jgi:hypothetical protein
LLSPRLRGMLGGIIPVDDGSRGYRAMNTLRIFAIGALAVVVTACQSATYTPRPIPVQPQGIEGQWTDPNGIVSSFVNGRFETRTTDTNSLLAEGTYRYVSDNMVEIEMTSLLRQTNSRVNCALASQSQLNCTSSTGAQFTLVRQFIG